MGEAMQHPLQRFQEWFTQAKEHPGIHDATAMSLATATVDGMPSVRIVLLKEASEAGFLFYTNLQSRKSGELKANSHAALNFYWPPLGKQIRVEGQILPASDMEADAYFNSRPRDRQIGAWASLQSQEMSRREELDARVAEIEKRFEGKIVPRPPYWSGWRVVPQTIEFWQASEARLHVRELYTRLTSKDSWTMSFLYP